MNTVESVLVDKINSLEAQLCLAEGKLRSLQEAQYSRESMDLDRASSLLIFMANRLHHRYGENPETDYIVAAIATATRLEK